MAEEMGVTVAGVGSSGAEHLTYPNMKEGGKEDGRKRGEGREKRRERRSKRGKT